MSKMCDFKKINWNCVTSKAFLQRYIQYLMEIEDSSDGFQVKTNNWHRNLCICPECLKMYQNYNVEFLLFIKTIECLPTEVLLRIFTNLLPSDRRIISLCCKRFLDIWLGLFPDDRHRLVFDDCILARNQEPLSTFMKSTRIYQHLVFGNVKMSSISIFDEKFAENVTTVELMYDPDDVEIKLSFLSQFPNLKTIKVANIGLLGNFSQVPTNIDLLVIGCVNSDTYTDAYKMPTKPGRIDCDELFSCNRYEKLKCYLDKTSDSFRIELNCIIESNNFIRSFTPSQRTKIQRFGMYIFPNQHHFLENLEIRYPALKHLTLDIFEILPDNDLNCLKIMKVCDPYVRENRARFSLFRNLEELKVNGGYVSPCCCLHDEAFVNKNLKTLHIYSELCSTCKNTIMTAFPNLENLYLNMGCHSKDFLQNLAPIVPKLQCLTLYDDIHPSASLVSLPNLTELSIRKELPAHMIKTWPSMLQLRDLNIRLSHLNIKTVKIFERMPALERLKIICGRIDGSNQLTLFQALTQPLKRLRKFEVIVSDECIQSENYPKIRDEVANNCNYLQRIKFYTVETEMKETKENGWIREWIRENFVLQYSSTRVGSEWSGTPVISNFEKEGDFIFHREFHKNHKKSS